LHDLRIPHSGGAVGHVTVSIGIAATDHTHDESLEALMERADRALYRAKHEGRARAVHDGRD